MKIYIVLYIMVDLKELVDQCRHSQTGGNIVGLELAPEFSPAEEKSGNSKATKLHNQGKFQEVFISYPNWMNECKTLWD